MSDTPYRTNLIIGAAPGISTSVARSLAIEGLKIGLVAPNAENLTALAVDIEAKTHSVYATSPSATARLFEQAAADLGQPDVVIYNSSARVREPIAELDPEAGRETTEATAYGGFLVTQQAAIRMGPKRHGTILLTGASENVKGFALAW